LAECVRALPNEYDDRDDYIKVGAAIKAAAGEENEADAFDVFHEWCAKWEGVNEDEVVAADWARLGSTFSIGWDWLTNEAKPHYNSAPHDFAVVASDPDAPPTYIERFNRDYATIRTASRSILYTPTGQDGKPLQHRLMPLEGWRTVNAHEQRLVATAKGERTIPV